MHVEELREGLRTLIPSRIRPYVKRTPVARAVNALLYWWDDFRFRRTRSPQSASWIDEETDRLRYSWQTFTTDYLRSRHGQDRDHPSRAAAYGILDRLAQELTQANSETSVALTALEVPFGMGTDYEMYFARSPFAYTGMELNPKQVEATRSRLPAGNWQIGNILAIPRPANTFSVVYCRHIYEHLSLEAMEIALAETIRVARDRCVFVFFDMREGGEHEARPVRKYHYNQLSCERLKAHLELNRKVKRVTVHRVPPKGPYKENYIFEVLLDPSVRSDADVQRSL
jgi:ubiquinone/menaquinone biosynthesis C-methylase UbiE